VVVQECSPAGIQLPLPGLLPRLGIGLQVCLQLAMPLFGDVFLVFFVALQVLADITARSKQPGSAINKGRSMVSRTHLFPHISTHSTKA